MKFSDSTLTILKNFATINERILFKKGNTLKIINNGKTIQAETTLDDTIPQDFAINDMNNFLSVLSMQKETPELEFDDKNVFIIANKGRSRITYRCTDAEAVLKAKIIDITTQECIFTITEDDFNWIQKSASVLQAPNIRIDGDGEKITVKILDTKNDAAHVDSLVLESPAEKVPVASFIFRADNWKMIPGPYKVSTTYSPIPLGLFEHQTLKLRYIVAIEAS